MLETARGEAANKWSNGITHRSGEEYRLGQLGKSPTFVSQTKSAGGESFIAVTVERTTYETTDEAVSVLLSCRSSYPLFFVRRHVLICYLTYRSPPCPNGKPIRWLFEVRVGGEEEKRHHLILLVVN
jgi:hypothetical protein